jgi:hypothetical protein
MNEFVNPQHRGVNLPAGFKDLMDVLSAKKKQTPTEDSGDSKSVGKTRVVRGRFTELEKSVCEVMESKAGSAMLGIFPKKRRAIAFYLLRKKNHLTAPFTFTEKDAVIEESVREIFAQHGIAPISDRIDPQSNRRLVYYPLPALLPAISEIVGQVLRCAYWITETDDLTLMIYECA